MKALFEKNKLHEMNWRLYVLIGIISAITFFLIYGVNVLNPIYTDWLLSGGDLTQHYLGWQAFRKGNWTFPIGCTNMLAYPNSTSVIFTDSIPIFAVFFKILSPILPDEFQYFGLWGIICFILQGILACRIIRNFTENNIVIMCTSIFALYSPVMILRMFGHTSLAGQWILLLAMEPVLAYKKYCNNIKIYKTICLIGFLAASIHMYFVLMCGIIVLGICVEDILLSRNIKRTIALLMDYLISVCVVVGLLGGFSSQGANLVNWGLGYYSLNLNSIFNPQGWSCIFLNLPLYTDGQGEGFAYLGAGGILLFTFALLLLLGCCNIKEILENSWTQVISVTVIMILICFIAVSPLVSINERLLYELKLPESIKNMWSIFRASGRIVMVVVYILVFCSIICLNKILNRRTMSIIIVVSLMLQVYDIHEILISKNVAFNQIVDYKQSLKNTKFWEKVGNNSEIQHVVITFWAGEEFYTFAEWALKNGMTMNSFAMAHPDPSALLESVNDFLECPSANDIFVFADDNKKMRCLKYNLNYYNVDGYIIGYLGKIDNNVPISRSYFTTLIWNYDDNLYLTNGEDTSEGRILYPGGLSYGPYWYVLSGNYTIVLSGENLTETTEVGIYSEGGEICHDFQIIKATNTEIEIALSLETDISDLEVIINNITNRNVIVNNVVIQKIE